MRYLLDTNICIYIARKRPPQVLRRFRELDAGAIAMSIVSYGELQFGAQKGDQPARGLESLAAFIEAVPVLSLGPDVAAHYGRLRLYLQKRGEAIGANDLWIASHCLELGMTLVTNNEREFTRVPNLNIENWTK